MSLVDPITFPKTTGPSNPVTPNPFGPSNPVDTTPPGGGVTEIPSVVPSVIPPSITGGAGGVLVYPPELATGEIRIAFSFYEYHKESLSVPTKFQSTGNTIFMPIPDGIIDQYTIGYDQYQPGFMADQIAQEQNSVASRPDWTVGSWLKDITKGVSSAVNNAWNPGEITPYGKSLSIDDIAKLKTRPAIYFAASALSKIGGLFEAGLAADSVQNIFGTILNPNTTVAFKAPALRSHNFSWMVAPKSAKDSNLIMNIVNEFKFHMLPDTDGGVLLKYPDIVFPEFIGTQKYLYTFKPCVITGFAAVPVGAGQPAFFVGTKAPTHIQITIQLLETELFLRSSVYSSQRNIAFISIDEATTAEGSLSTADDSNVLFDGTGTQNE